MNFSRIFNQRQNYQLVYIALILTEKLNGKSKIIFSQTSIIDSILSQIIPSLSQRFKNTLNRSSTYTKILSQRVDRATYQEHLRVAIVS